MIFRDVPRDPHGNHFWELTVAVAHQKYDFYNIGETRRRCKRIIWATPFGVGCLRTDNPKLHQVNQATWSRPSRDVAPKQSNNAFVPILDRLLSAFGKFEIIVCGFWTFG